MTMEALIFVPSLKTTPFTVFSSIIKSSTVASKIVKYGVFSNSF